MIARRMSAERLPWPFLVLFATTTQRQLRKWVPVGIADRSLAAATCQELSIWGTESLPRPLSTDGPGQRQKGQMSASLMLEWRDEKLDCMRKQPCRVLIAKSRRIGAWQSVGAA